MNAAFAEAEIITRGGRPVSVILPIKRYEELVERLKKRSTLPSSSKPPATRFSIAGSETILVIALVPDDACRPDQTRRD